MQCQAHLNKKVDEMCIKRGEGEIDAEERHLEGNCVSSAVRLQEGFIVGQASMHLSNI